MQMAKEMCRAICMIFHYGHDFPWPLLFLSFSLFSIGPISVIQFPNPIVLYVFYAFLDTLPMIVFSSSDSILIKSYKIICQPSMPGALKVL
jgi:hypothetical protein